MVIGPKQSLVIINTPLDYTLLPEDEKLIVGYGKLLWKCFLSSAKRKVSNNLSTLSALGFCCIKQFRSCNLFANSFKLVFDVLPICIPLYFN